MGRILVVEDDESLRRVTHAQLERAGHETSVAVDVAQALEILRKDPQDLVISDLNLPDLSGMELLKRVRAEYPETAVIIITAYGTIETAVEAIKCGAYDYITKPVHPEELKALVNRVLERHRLLEEVRTLRGAIDRKFGFENIIGSSSRLIQVLDSASSVAHTDATVLILGETGTRRERSSWQTAALCSWTKSVRCPWSCRFACCDWCRSTRSRKSARPIRRRWTCGSSPPRTAIWRAASRKASSG